MGKHKHKRYIDSDDENDSYRKYRKRSDSSAYKKRKSETSEVIHGDGKVKQNNKLIPFHSYSVDDSCSSQIERFSNSDTSHLNKHSHLEDHLQGKSKSISSRSPRDKPSKETGECDLEKELMFDWKDYAVELNKLFFAEKDIIKKGSEEHKGFWKFLQKYQNLNKQNKIVKKFQKSDQNVPATVAEKGTYDLPTEYDKQFCISFCLRGKDVSELYNKQVPADLEDDGAKRLSEEKLSEFKFILILYLDFLQTQKFNKLKGIRESQKNLPIAEYRASILKTIENNCVTILAGDTGCGKSTQIPQYLLRAGYRNIACTQPRRIACISLSKRVAYETLNEYGSSIGYQIRFEKSKTEHTKIVFLTEGLLLRQIASDPMLLAYNVLILDEIHERHLQTDFLLGVIKCLVVQRPSIKIILMSATINIELFANYFLGKAPVIQIPGRLFPIEVKYFPITMMEKASQRDKIDPAPYVRILQLIDKSYPHDERGDLLMFLSGIKEITAVMEAARAYALQSSKWVILPLHSTLSVTEQERVFDIPPEGVRKCIISTNIAETSITIEGVRFVVDSGKVKEMSYDPTLKMQKLKEFWISQASAEQRKGRSGRTGPGVCFRLYSEADYASFVPYNTPEILRVSLDSLILQMIAMGLPNIKLFPFIEPPSSERLDSSLTLLKSHSALTKNEELTTVGQLLAQLPLDVSLGKMLIMGSLFHQLGPVLSLAAALNAQSPFTNRAFRDPDCIALNKPFQSDHGDPFTLLNAYREWLYVKTRGEEDSRRWCWKRGLEEQRFYEMTKLRQQFTQMLKESGLRSLTQDSTIEPSSCERAKRYGELYQLRKMKKELYQKGPRKAQFLKVNYEGGVDEDEEGDVNLEIKDIDFKIRYDNTRLRELYKESKVESFKSVILLKIILCSGLYPNIGVADEHNNYKPGSEQLFHTAAKPFVVLHPNSVFSSEPQTLQLTQPDIANLKGFTERNPCSCRHQFLAFVSLLETNKPYLVNAIRVPVAQTLMLFGHNIDTNSDMSIFVFDNFIELKFADRIGAQNLLFQAVSLRSKWKSLLELRIRASNPSIENADRLRSKTTCLEKELSSGLIELFLNEQYYSVKRLLDADVKVLHFGPGSYEVSFGSNPFSIEKDESCVGNDVKGGLILTEYLTYNCLIDVDSNVTCITSYDAICPYCDQEFHMNTLERLNHMRLCVDKLSLSDEKEAIEEASQKDPTKKEYWCEHCQRTFSLRIKDILKHKKTHS